MLNAPVRRAAAALQQREKMSESQALSLAAYELTGMHQSWISIPKRFSLPMRDMIALQPRFEKTRGKRAMNLLEHRRFRAAYDFLMLRAEVGEVDASLAEFWTDVQTQSETERLASFQVQSSGRPSGKRRRPRRRRRTAPG